MRKIELIIWLLCFNIVFADITPSYEYLWVKQPIEVLEINTKIKWGNISDEEALEYCKNTQSLPKNKKQMEKYLKKHKFVWSLHYFSGAGCTYKGKVKFDGKIWDFVSVGGKTTLSQGNENIYLVCESVGCYPRAWSDEE